MKTQLILIVALLATSVASAQQWPTFRNDNARSGVANTELDAGRLQQDWHWQSELPPDPAWDGPARWDAFSQIRDLPAMRQYDACFHPVSDGSSVYFGSSSQDTLTALSLDNGQLQWSFVAGGPIRLAPTIDGGRILFGCDDGNAYCVDRKDGRLLWKFSPSRQQGSEQRRLINNDRLISYYPIRTGITVRDGLAYFGASFLPWRESYICAIDAETGKLDASKDTFVVKHDKATLEGNLLVADNRLIVPQGRVAPLMFDRTNGKSLGTLPGGGGVTIVLTETGEVVRIEGGREARSGQVGVFQGKQRVASFPRGRSLVIRDDEFFVIDGQKIFAADRNTNALKWSREVDEPLELVMAGGTIFVGGRDHVTAVDAISGNVVWSSAAEGRVFGLAVAGGKLIASTDAGHIHVFAPTNDADWIDADAANPIWQSPTVARVRLKNLLHRWVFHRSAMSRPSGQNTDQTELDEITVADQAGDADLNISGTAKAVRIGQSEKFEAIELRNALFPLPKIAGQTLPRDTISVEAWVRVDEPAQWGGIVGCIQDDGPTEHGWLLGYRSEQFCFALAGGGNGLTYLTANDRFKLKSWNHVVGTYNGTEMRLFVNGSLAASSEQEKGAISYTGDEHFTVAAYKDQNESYPLVGALHEVRIYSAPLDATTIANQYAAQANDFESNVMDDSKKSDFLAWGPYTRYLTSGVVEIRYGTNSPCESIVDLITEKDVRRVSDRLMTNTHVVRIDELPFRRELKFQIHEGRNDESDSSRSFSLDSHFDWTGTKTTEDSEWVAKLVADSPNPRGLVLVLGAEQADKAEQIARQSQLTVVLVVENETVAAQIRNQWHDDRRFVYGREICVTTTPIRELPAASAAVVISLTSDDDVRRLIRPQGGISHDGQSTTWLRESVEGSGVWSHMYGQADNSAFGGEHLSNASERQDLVTQWIGRPGPRYQTDRQNRKPSPLAAGGRLFLQGQQRMIALDSYSGTVLWSVESPTVMRWNVPHDCSNWCADDEGIYVAAENQAWFVDGRTGEITRQFKVPVNQDQPPENSWGYIGRYKNQLLGTVVRTSAIYTKWWGSSQWFDSTGGADTHVVAGDQLFSMDPQTGELHWQYEGLVLHPTITIMDDFVFFVEDKTTAHKTSATRRISLDEDQQHELVCLDVKTGNVQWRRPLAEFAGHIASFYLAGGGKTPNRSLVLVASESTKSEFSIQTFRPDSGDPIWNRTVAWEANHHGKHISRPAIEGDLVYLRPEVMKLASGETVRRGFPGGHGCSSYTLSVNGLFSRLGETTWWDVRHNKVNRFDRIRTDCWISVVPAQGMLLSAEGGGGCSCGSWLETSLGLLPRSVDEAFPEK